MPLQSR
jgi:hypothetical protein